jgi:recombination protein RecA
VITPLTADKRKALDLVTAQIDKQFGTGAIMRFGAAMPDRAIEAIPTGSIVLDLALGVGGIPRGRKTRTGGLSRA